MSEKCDKCGHDWHGLQCNSVVDFFREQCSCTTAWEDPGE